MLDAETRAFLEGGCSLTFGTVDADGMPHATRVWGLEVLRADGVARLRLLLDVDDTVTIAHVAAGGRIAVTATSVRTFRSLQLKGRAIGLDDARATDPEWMARHIDAFFADIMETDGTAPDLLETFRPYGCVPCVVEVDEGFVQTPGPGAGARLS